MTGDSPATEDDYEDGLDFSPEDPKASSDSSKINPYQAPASSPEEFYSRQALPNSEPVEKRHGGLAVFIAVVSIWAFEVILGIGMVIYVLSQNEGGTPPLDQLEETIVKSITPTLLGAITFIQAGFMTLMTWLVVCKAQKLSFKKGFVLKKLTSGDTFICLATGTLYAVLAWSVMKLFTTGESDAAQLVSTTEGLLVFSCIGLLAPFYEEFYYRGLIFPVFQRNIGATVSVLITGIWFCLAHVPQLWGDPAGIPILLGLGFLLGFVRHKYESLMAPILIHFVYNALLIVGAWVEKFMTNV